MAAFCNLPINAAIVIYLFCTLGHTLPSTRTALFKALVCNLLVRHIQLRTDHGLQAVSEFEGLPQPILEKLLFISSLAYRGIVQHMRMFSVEFLDTLGLMQVHQQLTMFGPCHHCSFLHFTVQEFLAAYHISKQSSSEQTKMIPKILHRDPLSPVLPFYAGLTNLSNNGVRDVLLEVTKKPLNSYEIFVDKPHAESSDRRRLALALLNCIFESQDSSICEFPLSERQSRGAKHEQKYIDNLMDDAPLQISFSRLGLEPMDCLSIGYFMANRKRDSCIVNISCCGVGDIEVEVLISQLKQVKSSQHKPGVLFVNNLLTSNAMKLIGEVLIPLVSHLSLSGCWHPAVIDIRRAFKYLLEGLSRSSCSILGLDRCCLTTEHVYHLVLLISCYSSIEGLDLSYNNIGSSIYMSLIAAALKHNSTLTVLTLDDCNVGDKELLLIGEALQTSKLATLCICSNPFSTSALTQFLQMMYDSELQELEIHRSLTKAQIGLIQQIISSRLLKNKATFVVSDVQDVFFEGVREMNECFFSLPPRIQSRLRTKEL